MTGWQGSGYNGPNPGGGAGRSSDEEETAIHQTTPPATPPAAPPWPPAPSTPQAPPPLSQPPAPGWGQQAQTPPAAPQPTPPPAAPAPQAGGWGQPPAAPGAAPQGWGTPPATPGAPQGWPGAPGAPGGYGAQPFVTPKKKGKLRLILAAIVVVLALVGGGVYYVYDSFFSSDGGSGSSKASSPGDVVKGYLEALSKGDAETALSYSKDQPASKDFLSNDILAKQIAEWPISDIRILNEDKGLESIGRADVHVAAKFGDKSSDATMTVKKDGDKWQLEHATIKVDLSMGASDNAARKSMTFFGKEISDESAVYVFPGYLDLASTSPYVSVTAKPLLLDEMKSYSSGAYLQPKFALTDSGTKAIANQLNTSFGSCQASHSLNPPLPCPAKLDKNDVIDGTVNWGTPDMSAVRIGDLNESDMKVRLSGQVTFNVSAQGKDGRGRTGTMTAYLSGATADVSKDPIDIRYS
ncbi:DUF4878 domain-containing protein [Mycobacterium sp. CBMA293]|uniref:DUF4878 domain-containing protein n=2 Tax=Mycolicibacterium TaxID=1866885 RepID=UPI0012DF13DC|nr:MULTISPECIES: DUF4878 domain-containing protein [unclassified Mycolicibacterium]MUL44514.1 DUF4878 domain-containing protein [Mycolicibacterium sp. CBMA 360]MUL59834.1 DUF4878 domain-containing protein [Mycolicibacterium sp. CBMA 335]MUL68677.1 DUF4878 domain-containing protein [Mycolicibacterium sp. CBMA 311]MUL93932.1 DUF4878 domain-containing protein [Mycolicibacterium sp. CBMA 230]MUM06178.1 hypothetical protein [Mycolicibacterium sp. CBMA 213]